MMVRATELYQAGWKPGEIRRLLHREGVSSPPSPNTIRLWADPQQSERARQKKREMARRTRLKSSNLRWPGIRGPEWRAARIVALREAGLSIPAIATVMTFDFSDAPMTAAQVETVLAGGMPFVLRRVA